MNQAPHQPAPASRRARVLRELGMTPWVRRAPQATSAVEPMDGTGASDLSAATTQVACVMVLPQDCTTRELDLLGRVLSACGPAMARAARIRANGGELAAGVPEARSYLVFGEAQAHALGRALPAAAMQHAQIVLADTPAQILAGAGAKRRLWSALRNLRRALATMDG